MKRPTTTGGWLAIVLPLLLLAMIVLRVVEGSRTTEAAPTIAEIRAEQGVPVSVAAVTEGSLEIWREFSGEVSGVRDAEVRARSQDQVSRVLVAVGDRVRQGQVLVRQQGEVTQARLRQAELAAAQEARAQDRQQRLFEAGAISAQDWERAQTAVALANADVAAARDAVTLQSPLAGVVTAVPAREGMIPATGDVLVRVAELSELVVRVQVSADDAVNIRSGQRARIPRRDSSGRVRRVALQADVSTRLVEVEISFPANAPLILGTLATVQVRVASRDRVVQLPNGSVRDGTVWVVGADNIAHRRSVMVGLSGVDGVEVISGVQPGERVVVDGGTLLEEGATVRIVHEAPAAPVRADGDV